MTVIRGTTLIHTYDRMLLINRFTDCNGVYLHIKNFSIPAPKLPSDAFFLKDLSAY